MTFVSIFPLQKKKLNKNRSGSHQPVENIPTIELLSKMDKLL